MTDKAPKPVSDEDSIETLADVVHRALVGSPIETRHLYLDEKARRIAEMVWAAGYRHESILRASNSKLRGAAQHAHAALHYALQGGSYAQTSPVIAAAMDKINAALKETE